MMAKVRRVSMAAAMVGSAFTAGNLTGHYGEGVRAWGCAPGSDPNRAWGCAPGSDPSTGMREKTEGALWRSLRSI